MTLRTHATEFPNFTLDVPLPAGFVDASWHNDAMPSFEKEQPDGTVLKLWIDFADRTLGDMADANPYFRFAVGLYSSDREWLSDVAFDNAYDAILAAIDEFEARLLAKFTQQA